MTGPPEKGGLDRRTVLRLGLAGASALVLGTGDGALAAERAGRIGAAHGTLHVANGETRAANASVERVHVPGNARELHAHLFLNAAIHHTAQQAGGAVDFGVRVTLIYQSGGRLVSLQSQRDRLGGHQASGVDSQTVRMVVKIPYGRLRPDPGTNFVARAQVFTMLPGGLDAPFGPAE